MKLIKFYENLEIRLFDIKNDISENYDLSKNSLKKLAKHIEKKLDNYLRNVNAPKWKKGITWKEKSLKNINSYH